VHVARVIYICILEMHSIYWSEDILEDLGIDERIILEWILGKYCGKVWTGCIWLRKGTNCGLL
jgi:hypothetical protein